MDSSRKDNLKSPITKFLKKMKLRLLEKVKAEPGDLICFIADKDKIVFSALSELRLEGSKKIKFN